MHTYMRQYLIGRGNAYTVAFTTSNPPSAGEVQDFNLILSGRAGTGA